MSKIAISVADFIKLPYDKQDKILYKHNSKELAEFRKLVKDHIKINGGNDTLQHLSDVIFSLILIHSSEEEDPVSIATDELLEHIIRTSPPAGTDVFGDRGEPITTRPKNKKR